MFEPSRLTLARNRRGLTKTALASDCGVSARSISAYESGATSPSDEVVARLTQSLAVPQRFFDASRVEQVEATEVSFRALSTLSAADRNRALASATLGTLLYGWIEDRFTLPDPQLDTGGDLAAAPEMAAEVLRAEWGIGRASVSNLLHLLEARGIRVLSLVEECRSLDAFSFFRDRTPFVFLNTTKSAERSRFDAAHELGHLVLHREGPCEDPRRRENEADRFASAFLMPRETILALGPWAQEASLDELIEQKRRWGVSVAALVKRLHDVGVISEWQYRSLYVELASRGFRRDEPKPQAPESSQVLNKVLRALADEGVGLDRIAADLAMASADLSDFLFGLASSGSDVQHRPVLRLVHG